MTRPRTFSRMRLRRLGLVAMLALSFLLPAPAHAAASGWVGNHHASVRLITAEQATGSAGTVDAGLEFRLAPGWHIYWREPGAAGLPPTISWHGSQNLKQASLSWPAPLRSVTDGLQTYGYAGTVVLPIAAELEHPGAPLRLHATVNYLACRDICVPFHAVLDLSLPAGIAVPGPEAGRIAAAAAHVPGDLAELGLKLIRAEVAPAGAAQSELALVLKGRRARLTHPDLFVEGLPRGAPGPPRLVPGSEGGQVSLVLRGIDAPAAEIAGRTLTFTLTDGPGRAATFSARPIAANPASLPGPLATPLATPLAIPLTPFALAFLGGLLLNVMPCVLPVLALKLMGLVALAGVERRAARRELLASAGGVLAGFAVLASALIGLKAVGASIGWGIQFQEPWFLAAMTMVMVLFAADLWGWITITTPRGLAALAIAGRRRHLGALLTGAFATLLATSCSAPFVGTAVGFALARGPMSILAIFLAMGLGLSLPYLLGAAAPRLIIFLPRPGPWMVRLARLFGVFLLGTALWLLLVLFQVGGTSTALMVGVLAALLLGTLGWRHRLGGRREGLRRIATVAASGLAAAAILAAELGAAGAGTAAPRAEAASAWHPFTQEALAQGLAEGKRVVIDVTAAWCLICQVNAATVLDRAPVAGALAAPDILLLRADWTRPDPAITRYLQSFGRYGVPLDVVYGPASPAGIVLPDLLTSGDVLRALDRAAGMRQAAER
ncbi:MAG TPA: protein-disulfide reductase DsbD domain-containing protein [Acetobacteraceae bacterium]|nr:protein-disulfide reductase DsbD domain-containing protein [Acetobacteraceae bacterium]